MGSTLFQVALVLLSSLLEGVVRYGTGSLWPTIATHFLWDSAGVLGQGSVADLLGPLIQFAAIVSGVVGLLVLARRTSPAGPTPADAPV